ncbi:MAG: M10 family metallopeptidase C-terminal domain-containing protein [Rhodobacteraceae bacterium]|jgi:serralysin|nr:M10 family metallopeptidase C-terminal domain-containing protein [Paracoccaceae bacterium]
MTATAELSEPPSRAILLEGIDAPSGALSTYRMGVEDTFNGSYASALDEDWVGINLVAGQTYRFNLDAPTNDTFLTLFSGNGIRIADDDDSGPGLSSQLTFTATATGLYFLEVSQYPVDAGPGTYSISVSLPPPLGVWTVPQMVDQLINGYWEDDGRGARHFDVQVGTAITVNLTALTPTMIGLARMAMQAWTDTTGLVFREVTGPAGITFTADAGNPGPDAFANSITNSGFIASSTVNIDQEWLDSSGTDRASYTFQTYIHEIGHAIGLGHAGNYNSTATYGTDNLALNDSWQLTIMSYFDQAENSHIADTRAYLLTPMLADIAAIAQMYGTATQLRTGNTTYGEGSNAGGTYNSFSAENTDGSEDITVAMTVVDSGGIDTFDFRSDSQNQRIDLRQGMVSDVYGDLGTLQIALGTVIENVVAGTGSDRVTGNAAANRIEGSNGNDALIGEGGNDTLLGGDGMDTLNGGAGADSLVGGASTEDLRDVVYGGDGNDTISGGYGNDDLNGGANDDLIIAGFGADTVVGNAGHDLLAGEAGSDAISGNAGNDTINGGFGHDRLNGGTGADRFLHAGVVGHGSDWIQDYSSAQGDALVFIPGGAVRSQFQVNYATTPNAGAANVAEAFVIYRPTGQILWALVDGGDDAAINLKLGDVIYDLLA